MWPPGSGSGRLASRVGSEMTRGAWTNTGLLVALGYAAAMGCTYYDTSRGDRAVTGAAGNGGSAISSAGRNDGGTRESATGGRSRAGGVTTIGGSAGSDAPTMGGAGGTVTGGRVGSGGTDRPSGGAASEAGGPTTGGGGAPTGGATGGGGFQSGRTGGVPFGGSQTGGAATGGRPTGGAPAGGQPTGGAPTGGQPTGGQPTGGALTGGAPTGGVPPLTNPTPGYTTTSWSCCKPACGWASGANPGLPSCDAENQSLGVTDQTSSCEGGPAHLCWDLAPWSVNDTLAYGFAASATSICGGCYQMEFTGETHTSDDPGSLTLTGKTLLVQIVDIGGTASGQFDLLVPGGGVGSPSACEAQWGTSALGEMYGGLFQSCRDQDEGDHEGAKGCARQWCQDLFGDTARADLLRGCLWWVDWMNLASVPEMNFEQVPCPSELKDASGL